MSPNPRPPESEGPLLPDIFDEPLVLPDGTMVDLIHPKKAGDKPPVPPQPEPKP